MNINRGRQIVYIEPLCLTLTPSAVDASPYAWGSNYPQNLYPGPQKHLINPKRATDPVLPAESLCSVNSCSRPVCWAFSMEIFAAAPSSFLSFPWVTFTGSAPHLVTHSRMAVSKLVNFVVESAAVAAVADRHNKFSVEEVWTGGQKLELVEEDRFFKDGKSG